MDNIKFVFKGKELKEKGHQVDGVTYAPVRALAEALGHQVGWYGPEQTVYIDTPLPSKPEQPLKGRLFIVDYGHGRDNKTGVGDPGAVDGKDDDRIMTYEDDLVMLYGREFTEGLRKLGAIVVETRPDDKFVSLEERVRIANRFLEVDAFISWHANAGTPAASGYEVLIAGTGGPAEQLARALIRIVESAGVKLHGDGLVVNPKIMVLNSTRMPAVLNEIGFITNPGEEAKLNTPDYRHKLVAAALAGVIDWMKEKK
ncbi:MAG: N-acetylmuramoyl-L-alanine amidase family protein, partial [Bacillota bacterium]